MGVLFEKSFELEHLKAQLYFSTQKRDDLLSRVVKLLVPTSPAVSYTLLSFIDILCLPF